MLTDEELDAMQAAAEKIGPKSKTPLAEAWHLCDYVEQLTEEVRRLQAELAALRVRLVPPPNITV